MAAQPARSRLGDVLVDAGVVSREHLDRALAEQAAWGGRLGQLLPLGVAERYGIMPLGRRDQPKRLLLACFDPTMGESLAEAERDSGLKVEVCVATASAIERAIRRVYYGEAAPAAIPGAGAYSITRNTRDPFESGTMSEDVMDRVAELEREVEKLKQLVETLIRPKPR